VDASPRKTYAGSSTLWIADAHRDVKRYVGRADEILTALWNLEWPFALAARRLYLAVGEIFPSSASLNDLESGGEQFPASFFALRDAQPIESTQREKRKGSQQHMNPPFQLKMITLPLLIAFALLCFALLPMGQAAGLVQRPMEATLTAPQQREISPLLV
jgi:hypothetical protein